MRKQSPIRSGVQAMMPIIPGVIPFGLIMGTAASGAGMRFYETMGMNLFVFAGASQLVAVDLMSQNIQSIVVVFTGLIINMRMVLYSAALAPSHKALSMSKKSAVAYFLTDQAYAVTVAHEEGFSSMAYRLRFYFGAAVFMSLSWHVSVILGFIFGNITPSSLSLEFAVPLSFMALTIPSLKSKVYVYVALVSSLFAILLHAMPYGLGLLFSAAIGIAVGAFLTRSKVRQV